MSAVVVDASTMAEHAKYRKPGSQNHPPSSSTASSKVSVPAVIRTSANWNANKVKKKKVKNKKINNNNNKLHTDNSTAAVIVTSNIKNNNSPSPNSSQPLAASSNCGGSPDEWCGPGNRLTVDAAASENCVVSRRPAVSARNKSDGVHRIIHSQREHSSYSMRRMVTSEDIPYDPVIALGMQRSGADVSRSRYHRHLRHDFHDGFAEIVMLQSSLLMGERSEQPDQYRGWRLDVDNMSYEELLELGDRIGHVSTGLREDEISCCLRRSKVPMLDNLSPNFPTETERKCSICQEEYETDDETGKLNCGHFYHIQCVKQWLVQKNICPICKKSAMPQT